MKRRAFLFAPFALSVPPQAQVTVCLCPESERKYGWLYVRQAPHGADEEIGQSWLPINECKRCGKVFVTREIR